MTLEIITARALRPIRHGFFTRRGGASSGVFEGLNCGAGSSDQSDMVRINRDRVAGAMGVAPERLVTLHQVHSAEAVSLSAPPEAPIRADAMVTATPGLALAVLTADCQPVLFADAAAGVVGAAHAGWKGALDGVLEATLARWRIPRRRPGARRRDRPDDQPGGLRGRPRVRRALPRRGSRERPVLRGRRGDRAQFDLPGYGLYRLRAAGVGEALWTRHCTYADPARFFSYRRSLHQREADYGRLISAIRV
jgi:polyphenol oxidase